MDIGTVTDPQGLAGFRTNDVIGSATELGKDDFLRILITQLQNQDPTAPVEDKEFIAQLAQFSALEQIQNLASGFNELKGVLNSSRALDVLGKTVEIAAGEAQIIGTVSEVTSGHFPQVLVNDVFYDFEQIAKVRN